MYDTLPPFSSRVSPGLNVHFTPVRGDIFTYIFVLHSPGLFLRRGFGSLYSELANVGFSCRENLCPLIKEAFGGEIDCLVPEVS